MKIGIITFANCMNYGAELQAFALQHKLNEMGYDAELVHIEKECGMLEGSVRTIFNAIVKRVKTYGLLKGLAKTYELIVTKRNAKKSRIQNKDRIEKKKKLFDDFFSKYIRHSSRYYTLDELESIPSLSYDAMVAGSDQIWNYMQTRHLGVFFLEFANNFNAKKISYAASFSVDKIPQDLRGEYKRLLNNMDAISVRENVGVRLVRECSGRDASLVVDPTLLMTSSEWVDKVGNPEYLKTNEKFVVIYTLSGSTYIYTLAKNIGKKLGLKVLNIKSNFMRCPGDDGIEHLTDVGPREFISVMDHAAYVITDSFHGTAFSINFNVPFTTLLNPVSAMNSRALSILEETGLKNSRLIYDDGSNREPDVLTIDYAPVNKIISDWRSRSILFIKDNLS